MKFVAYVIWVAKVAQHIISWYILPPSLLNWQSVALHVRVLPSLITYSWPGSNIPHSSRREIKPWSEMGYRRWWVTSVTGIVYVPQHMSASSVLKYLCCSIFCFLWMLSGQLFVILTNFFRHLTASVSNDHRAQPKSDRSCVRSPVRSRKILKSGICFFSTKHASSRSKNKDLFEWSQDHVAE